MTTRATEAAAAEVRAVSNSTNGDDEDGAESPPIAQQPDESNTGGVSNGRAEAPEEPLSPFLQGPIDQSRMQLTPQERQWAVSVKEAIQNTPDLDGFSDFMIAQIAMVESGNIEQSLIRAQKLQTYKEDFGVLDTYQDGKRMLQHYFDELPNNVIHYFFNAQIGKIMVVYDFSKLDPKITATHESTRAIFSALYYTNQVFLPDLEAVREGVFLIIECAKYKWKGPNMIGRKFFKMMFDDIIDYYPMKVDALRFCNTGYLVNIMISMTKRFIPNDIMDSIEVVLHSDYSMDEVCLVPTPEAANKRVLRSMTEALRRRYEAEKTFTL